MGFGLLLIGYFLTNVLPVISVFSAAMLLGYPLITVALYRLAPYHKGFYIAMWFSLPATLFALYHTLYSLVLVGLLPEMSLLGGTVLAVVQWLYFAYAFLLHGMILWSVSALTAELGLYTVQSAALRNLTFVLVYHLAYLIIKLPIPFFRAHAAAFVLPIVLLRCLYMFLNLWLFFRCYRYILPEGSDPNEPTHHKRNRERREQK